MTETEPFQSKSRSWSARTYTVEQTRALLGLSRSATYRAVQDGSLPSIKVGRRYLVVRSKLDEMLGIVEVAEDDPNGGV